jgi:choline-sulfatase
VQSERATFLTGLMPAQHGVVDTLTADGPVSCTETELSRDIPNLATVLRAGGYDVHSRGTVPLPGSKGKSYTRAVGSL